MIYAPIEAQRPHLKDSIANFHITRADQLILFRLRPKVKQHKADCKKKQQKKQHIQKTYEQKLRTSRQTS